MSPAMRLTIACVLFSIGCGAERHPYTGSGGGGGSTATLPDAGITPADAGTVAPTCAPDTDGNHAGGVLSLAEVALGANGTVEIFASGGATVDLSAYALTVDGTSDQATIPKEIVAGGRILLHPGPLGFASGELALEKAGVVTNYMCWGMPGTTTLAQRAVGAAAWFAPGVCAAVPAGTQSLHNAGLGGFAADWVSGSPSLQSCVP